ncbi:PilW family protein [Synechococcus sp. PCC 7336]|uniref:PilW family protein n=1 Tax=Synechococcus sp. PCC 7336 TaxID=195250 RepID=UPI00034994F0|nr:hypothetical protein [Synechococcus sp. PCC 7336]
MYVNRPRLKLALLATARGFTLAEALVATIMSGFVLASLGVLFSSGVTSYRTNEQIVSVTQSTEVATALLQSDVRLAGYLGNGVGNLPGSANPVVLQNNIEELFNAGGWPFHTGNPANPLPTVTRLAAGAAADDGGTCSSNAMGSGCIQIISLNEIFPTTFTIDYVRYWITGATATGRPTLMRANNTYTCTSSDAMVAAPADPFECTIDNPAGAGQVAEGIEDFRLYWSNGSNWFDWETSTMTPGSNRRVGIYLRGRSVQPELDRQYPYDSVDIDLPAGVAPDVSGGTFDPRFRRIEKWLDIVLFNPQV